MRLGPKIITLVALLIAAGLSLLSAGLAADAIEQRSYKAVRTALIEAGHEWANVHTDGLQVHIDGEAPTEARRFNALSISGQVVDANRVVDGTTVTPAAPLVPPRFSVEVLRNDEGVSLIGLVPSTLDTAALVTEIGRLTDGAAVTSFLESADHPVPSGWVEALDFGLDALQALPRSKISIAAGEVSVTAISSSVEEKRRLSTQLTRKAPRNLALELNISAPRPVLTPFVLRFLIDETGPRFDACAADNDAGRERILSAARAAGMQRAANCPLALGVPTPDWPVAVEMGIAAVAELKGGSITFSDADVALIATETTPQTLFDKVVGELESNLPDVFSLKSILPEPPVTDTKEAPPPEFSASRSAEGQVQLRGRLPNQMVHDTVESFARARFGMERVYMAARIDEDLPEDWSVRVLSGLRALSELHHGDVTVLADRMIVRGVSGDQGAQGEISRIFAEKLGQAAKFDLSINYDPSFDPLTGLPTPQECIDRITLIQGTEKISFGPGSIVVEGQSAAIVDRIADVLRTCRDVDMTIEIGGHTDSQGREEMNLDLSQARAQAVLEALVARRVRTSRITAKGYGESRPIADNDTDEGREANRRIEFTLLAGAEDAPDSVEAAEAEAPTVPEAAASDSEPFEIPQTLGDDEYVPGDLGPDDMVPEDIGTDDTGTEDIGTDNTGTEDGGDGEAYVSGDDRPPPGVDERGAQATDPEPIGTQESPDAIPSEDTQTGISTADLPRATDSPDAAPVERPEAFALRPRPRPSTSGASEAGATGSEDQEDNP